VRGPPQVDANSAELEAQMAGAPENLVAAAQEVVAAATGGQVAIVKEGADEAPAPAPAQSGGVYLFVNPLMRDQLEPKARRARQRGGGGPLRWDGMPGVSGSEQRGGGDEDEGRGGHGAAAGATGATEVTVVKEE